MVVYIDVLFALNLIVDYFILLSVSRILHRNDKRLRIFFGAVFGAFYAVFVFYPEISFIYSAVFKIFASAIIVLITYKCSSVKSFLKLLICFYLINFLFGGVIFAVYLFAAPPGMLLHNGVLYINISPLLLIAGGAGCYVFLGLVSRILNKARSSAKIYNVELEVNQNRAVFKALLDTGNSLCDAITGAPVVIAEYSAVEPVIPTLLRSSFKQGYIDNTEDILSSNWAGRLRMIPFGSVDQAGGLLPAFRPDRLIVIDNENKTEVHELLIAVCVKKLSNTGEYTALLNPLLVSDKIEEKKSKMTVLKAK